MAIPVDFRYFYVFKNLQQQFTNKRVRLRNAGFLGYIIRKYFPNGIFFYVFQNPETEYEFEFKLDCYTCIRNDYHRWIQKLFLTRKKMLS